MSLMRDILLLGAGKIGSVIAQWLAGSGDYRVCLADLDEERLQRCVTGNGVDTLVLDVTDAAALQSAMTGKFAVLSACPFHITRYIARGALEAGIHYLDLTEDVETTRLVRELAGDSRSAFIPQCGLAPGFISIAAWDLARGFERLHNVNLRVGALPKYPSNGLKYNLTWSTAGLINEYCNPCEAIVEGERIQVLPLEELERFSLDGIEYEAFNTSGGLGTLCDSLEGEVGNLNYRSVRYPGHRDIMKILLQDLRLRDRQALLTEIFDSALPVTYQDVVLIFINVSGMRDGQLVQETYANKIYSREIDGHLRSAIQITTAAGICTVLDLLAQGKLPQQGFVRQEDVSFADFIDNRFGRAYRLA